MSEAALAIMAARLLLLMLDTVRAENLVHGSDQQGCPPGLWVPVTVSRSLICSFAGTGA